MTNVMILISTLFFFLFFFFLLQFLGGDVPRITSYGVYISQLIRFARVSIHLTDFNARNKKLTAKLLQQQYRYHKLFLNFIVDTLNWFLYIIPDYDHFCNNDCRNLNFMVS